MLRAVQKWEPGTRHCELGLNCELGNFYSGAEVPESEQHASMLADSGVFLVTLCSREASEVILQIDK